MTKRRQQVPLRPRSAYPTMKVDDCMWCQEPMLLIRKGSGARLSRFQDRRDYWWEPDLSDHDCTEGREGRASLARVAQRLGSLM